MNMKTRHSTLETYIDDRPTNIKKFYNAFGLENLDKSNLTISGKDLSFYKETELLMLKCAFQQMWTFCCAVTRPAADDIMNYYYYS